jgi:hypothetical protein
MTSRNVPPFRYALEHPSGATHEEGLRYIGLIFNSILTTTKKTALTKRHRGWPHPFFYLHSNFFDMAIGEESGREFDFPSSGSQTSSSGMVFTAGSLHTQFGVYK